MLAFLAAVTYYLLSRICTCLAAWSHPATGYEVADITVAAYRYLSSIDSDNFLLPRIYYSGSPPAEGDSGYEVADITVAAYRYLSSIDAGKNLGTKFL